MNTIGEAISRVRGSIKAVNSDSFITDRLIHSLIVKYAKMYIRAQDLWGSRIRFGSLFREIPCVELQEVNKIEACCNVDMDCKYMRSAEPIPEFLEGPGGPLIRSVTSIDGSTIIYRTTPFEFTKMSKTSGFKYNKKKYYWIINNHLYFPNVSWRKVRLEGIFEKDISGNFSDDCAFIQSQPLPIPPDLLVQIEKHVIEDLANRTQINPDTNPSDKRRPIR